MKTFASAVLGGVGVLPGAMVGGLVVGVIETFGASYISSGYRDAISFVDADPSASDQAQRTVWQQTDQ